VKKARDKINEEKKTENSLNITYQYSTYRPYHYTVPTVTFGIVNKMQLRIKIKNDRIKRIPHTNYYLHTIV